jgi:hypothetical protein
MNKPKQSPAEWLLLFSLLLAAVAYWAPWVGHPSAALKLSGQDLGEFVKFIPKVGSSFPRQLFYIPPLACSLCLVLLATGRTRTVRGYPRWLRIAMMACALLLLPGLLPPAWGHPREIFTPEFRLQGLAVLLGLAAILGHGLVARISGRARALTVGTLAFFALIPPQAAFWAVRERMWAIYQTPTIYLGWGIWLHIAAWLGVLAGAWLALAAPATSVEKT